jgi:hypothetical protein
MKGTQCVGNGDQVERRRIEKRVWQQPIPVEVREPGVSGAQGAPTAAGSPGIEAKPGSQGGKAPDSGPGAEGAAAPKSEN